MEFFLPPNTIENIRNQNNNDAEIELDEISEENHHLDGKQKKKMNNSNPFLIKNTIPKGDS